MKYNMICPQCKGNEALETNDFPQAKTKEGAQYQCELCRCKIKLRVYKDGFVGTKRDTNN